MRILSLLFAAALLGTTACSTQPTANCLIQRATGGITYAAQYTNQILISNTADCQVLGDDYTIDPASYVIQNPSGLGGLPFRVSLLGLDKFTPAAGPPSSLGITPEIFLGTSVTGVTTTTAFGNFASENPDDNGLCSVPDMDPTTFDVDYGAAGVLTTTFKFSNVQIYSVNLAQGTQLSAHLVLDVGTCQASYDIIAYAPAAMCVQVDADGVANVVDANGDDVLDPGGDPIFLVGGTNQASAPAGTQIITAANEQENICLDFNAPANDLQWTRYNTIFVFPAWTGNTVNAYFPLTCDSPTGYCVLTGNAIPALLATPRP